VLVPCVDEVDGAVEFLVSDPSFDCLADKISSRTKSKGDRNKKRLSLRTFR